MSWFILVLTGMSFILAIVVEDKSVALTIHICAVVGLGTWMTSSRQLLLPYFRNLALTFIGVGIFAAVMNKIGLSPLVTLIGLSVVTTLIALVITAVLIISFYQKLRSR